MSDTIKTIAIDDNKKKCKISEGCFSALMAHAGCRLQPVSQDIDCGVDFRLIRTCVLDGAEQDGSNILDFQLKATSKWTDHPDHIEYSLRNKNYNNIVLRNMLKHNPIILIVMCIPDLKKCVSVSHNDIVFQRTMYWYHTDSLTTKKNQNSSTKIKIPKKQLLTKKSIVEIIRKYGM